MTDGSVGPDHLVHKDGVLLLGVLLLDVAMPGAPVCEDKRASSACCSPSTRSRIDKNISISE